MKILVVDDHESMRDLICAIIKRSGDHEVVEAVDGIDAWTKIHEHKPDAVITDMQMPNKDGLQVIQYVHRSMGVIPCLLHSSDSEYRDPRGERRWLKGLEKFFPKLTVRKKGTTEGEITAIYVKEFIEHCMSKQI